MAPPRPLAYVASRLAVLLAPPLHSRKAADSRFFFRGSGGGYGKSAYMLVYVAEAQAEDLMRPVDDADVPAPLKARCDSPAISLFLPIPQFSLFLPF